MTIEEAAKSLYDHLTSNPDDAGVFCVYPSNDGRLRVDVNFIYRIPEVELIKEWEGFSVFIGRRSCW